MTLLEVVIVIAVLFMLIAMVVSMVPNANQKRKAMRIQCVNNLKQVGLAFRIWAGDHGDKYPMEISETNGGTREYTTGPNAYRHFQIISNEISTPRALFCPAESDRWRIEAYAFEVRSNPAQVIFENNTNLSYFVGVDANPTNIAMILSGDHNVTNGMALVNGILTATTNRPVGWTDEVHRRVGNLTMGDGSVQQVSISDLRGAVEATGFEANRLQMP